MPGSDINAQTKTPPKARTYAVWFALAGILVSTIFTFLFEHIEGPLRDYVFGFGVVLWPSVTVMIYPGPSFPDPVYFQRLALSFGVNGAVYAVIGLMVWYGVYRRKWVLYVLFGLLAVWGFVSLRNWQLI
jgi:hypothetical protein